MKIFNEYILIFIEKGKNILNIKLYEMIYQICIK